MILILREIKPTVMTCIISELHNKHAECESSLFWLTWVLLEQLNSVPALVQNHISTNLHQSFSLGEFCDLKANKMKSTVKNVPVCRGVFSWAHFVRVAAVEKQNIKPLKLNSSFTSRPSATAVVSLNTQELWAIPL